ncbi:YbaL family putative K(+) efflux transporter [Sphingomonas sp. M1-B02]|uniref:YbaL family putative K(+) efflux transporter n=1 Tax=Sphingomonas sp. M1-B02 TaxID=3114300 RepID=UPI00223EB7EA|nr:YbaL family putative K(+) efflux transporter [Sphingomonas sp. S6-11]UZK67174.1 Kef family K(+) transporter [Sphingomonas sp. S6-11]
MHHTPLIAMIVAGLVIAFVMGSIAHRLKVSPIAGYLVAGVLVGPFTPGFVGDADLAGELAEIGVILLMFGVGLHFSLKDLLSVRKVAIPGAVGQITVATLMGMALAWSLGWNLLAGFVFGLALSVASTVVLLRALQGQNLVQTERGRIAVGWLIVEDLAMVLALVLLPALAGALNSAEGATLADVAAPIASTFFKVAGFVAVMLLIGRRLIPAVLQWVVDSGSRELFRLAVLAIALGVAFGAAFVFDVSFALGAFFAGMILGETPMSRQATEETLPLRDAFAVLFFVSVGMLFDPAVLIEQPLPLLATVAIIIVGKSVAAYAIVRALKHGGMTAITAAASLAQIGEFSFILATLGTSLNILPPEGRDLILAGAIISIFLNPFLFSWLVPGRQDPAAVAHDAPILQREHEGHVVLIGYGRVGRLIAADLKAAGQAFALIEDQSDVARQAEEAGIDVVRGNALDSDTLAAANIGAASRLLIAIPEGYEAGVIAKRVRELNQELQIIARAHSDAEVAHLRNLGVLEVVMGEREIATRMLALC